jgi:hypothetical protein
MSNFTAEARRRGENPIGCHSFDHPITRFAPYVSLKAALGFLKAALREIFDEAAYDRFLARTHSERSVSSYGAFMRERENAMAHKQRCC